MSWTRRLGLAVVAGAVAFASQRALEFLYPPTTAVVFIRDANWGSTTVTATETGEPERFFLPGTTGKQTSSSAMTEFDFEDLNSKLDSFLAKSKKGLLQGLTDVPSSSFEYGIPAARFQSIVHHLRFNYSWTERALKLSAYPHFRMRINGLLLHYIHMVGQKDKVCLLLHGWPGSFVEFQKTARLLNDKGYTVIVPSLPSFGWSEAPVRRGFSFVDAAVVMHKLLVKLNFSLHRVLCQGGDYGAFVCTALGQLEPRIKLHLNFVPIALPPLSVGSLMAWPLMQFAPFLYSDDTLSRFKPSPFAYAINMATEQTGYFHIQGTKPDTLGIGFVDSPVFLLGWIMEKFFIWTDDMSDIALDELLDNCMVYIISNSGTTSARWYKEMMQSWDSAIMSLRAPVPNPVFVLDAPNELMRPPRSWLSQRFPNLKAFKTLEKGGHFLALQVPQIMADDIDAAFTSAMVDQN